jgi:hypothetical protein
MALSVPCHEVPSKNTRRQIYKVLERRNSILITSGFSSSTMFLLSRSQILMVGPVAAQSQYLRTTTFVKTFRKYYHKISLIGIVSVFAIKTYLGSHIRVVKIRLDPVLRIRDPVLRIREAGAFLPPGSGIEQWSDPR